MSLLSFAAETKQELTQLEVQYDYSNMNLRRSFDEWSGWDFDRQLI